MKYFQVSNINYSILLTVIVFWWCCLSLLFIKSAIDCTLFFVPLENISFILILHHCHWRACKISLFRFNGQCGLGWGFYHVTPAETWGLAFCSLIRWEAIHKGIKTYIYTGKKKSCFNDCMCFLAIITCVTIRLSLDYLTMFQSNFLYRRWGGQG